MQKTHNRLSPIPYGDGEFDSGANPDFQVTSATRNVREMARLLKGVRAQSSQFDRKLRALESLEASKKQADVVLLEEIEQDKNKAEAAK